MRRQLLGLLAAPLAMVTARGDGLVRPQNAPAAQQTPVGVQPGAQAVTIAHYVIVFGPGGGVFVYSGTPGKGNPPVAWMASGTTDPYGNALPNGARMGIAGSGSFSAGNTITSTAGTFSYSGAPAAGNLVYADVPANATDAFGNQVFAGLNILTPFTAGQARLANFAGGPGQNAGIIWYSSTVGQNTWQSGAAVTPQAATSLTVSADTITMQPVTGGVTPVITADSWHNIVLDGAWTAGAQVPQYRLTPWGDVEVRGQATTAATSAALNINSGTPIPAAYRPGVNRVYRPPVAGDAAGTAQIATTGVFAMRASGFSATQVFLDGFYSI